MNSQPKSHLRVTSDMIEARILSESYEVRADGRTTVCEITLDNGWTERGESSCGDPADFDGERAKPAARAAAKASLWKCFAFLAREQAHTGAPSVVVAASHLRMPI
ncbi:Gp49 family protein [Burkholderia ambifaria]|uniref:Gp49 family protein n=1 Tax=Burkholderia ambifaria TaxID=152480 RepID=UPI00158B58D3|nr:Gp49 family protein [Burkholderia ambifaria]